MARSSTSFRPQHYGSAKALAAGGSPIAADMAIRELAINYNASEPTLFIRDNATTPSVREFKDRTYYEKWIGVGSMPAEAGFTTLVSLANTVCGVLGATADADTIINRWDEVVKFLENIGESATLDSLLASKANTNQTMYIGTTSVVINRASATLNLTGIGSLAMAGSLSGITTLGTSGLATLASASVTGVLSVGGVTTVSGDVLPNATNSRALGSTSMRWSNVWSQLLNVAGAATLSSTVAVTGAATFNSTATIRGNAIISDAANTAGQVQIGGALIVWDDTNQALKIVGRDGIAAGSLYATGGLTALGASTISGGGGSGGLGEDLMWSVLGTNQNNSTKKLHWGNIKETPNTIAGYGIVDAITIAHLHNAANGNAVAWADVSGKPTTFAPSSHTHGNITNAGAIGSAANLPIITGAAGALQVGAFGTAANTFCAGNDSRLSDSRTPVAHNQASNTISAMTGYAKGTSIASIAAADAMNVAIGKIEYKADLYASLANLTDTTISAPFEGQILQYSGGKWVNSNTIDAGEF